MQAVLNLQSDDDPTDAVHRAVQALVEGKVVALPTDTVYGLAASALSPGAVEAICELKGRDSQAPLAMSVASADAAGDFVCEFSPLARRLAQRCFPGPITLILPCRSRFSAIGQLPLSVRSRILGEGDCVGFRVIEHRVIDHIHRLLSAPLILTSANRSGNPAPTTAEGVIAEFGGNSPSGSDLGKSGGIRNGPSLLPLLLDDGPTRYGGPSTVVRVADRGLEILRSGAIEPAAMNQFAKPTIAIVCTGNTCRSPMAEQLLRSLLLEKYASSDVANVVSAGLAAGAGSAASSAAVDVMLKRKLDLSSHASQPLSDDIIQTADVILTMTRGHKRAILAAWPTLADRVHTLRQDGGDVTDPVGCSVDVYETCATQIEAELRIWLEQWSGDLLADSTGETGS